MPYQPASSDKRANYSIVWARGIVNQALERHARVRDSFLINTGLSREQLAILLASGRPEWPLLRSMLSQADQWASKQGSLGIEYASHGTLEFWQAIFTRKRANYPPKLASYLDRQLQLPDS